MLDKAALEGLKISIKMEELSGFLDKIIDKAGEELQKDAREDNLDARFIANRAREYGEVIDKCYEIKGIMDAIRNNLDADVERLYKYIFRNDPVALNLEKIV